MHLPVHLVILGSAINFKQRWIIESELLNGTRVMPRSLDALPKKMNEQVLEDFLLDKILVDNFVTKVFEKPNYKVGEFKIIRDHLLKLCDQTIDKKIDIGLLENLADHIVFSDYFCWDNETTDGEIVSETLFDWGNPTINFPINELNLKLWKEYLKTGDYRLKDFNNWNTHIDRQKEVCKKVKADWHQ